MRREPGMYAPGDFFAAMTVAVVLAAIITLPMSLCRRLLGKEVSGMEHQVILCRVDHG
jgi:hypothetical protein